MEMCNVRPHSRRATEVMYGAHFLFLCALYGTCLGLCFSLYLNYALHTSQAKCNSQTGLPNILI